MDLSEPKLTLLSSAPASNPVRTGTANSGKNNAGAQSNPYGHMGIQDADYRAYREGKLTEDDLLGIAQAVALYDAADGSYHYQNAAHDRAAEIRTKYDPNYRKNDIYDYTHGGKYDPNSTGPVPGPPRYQIPTKLSADARAGAGQSSGYSVYTSPRPPKMEENKSKARDFGDNDQDKSALYELGQVIGDMANLYIRPFRAGRSRCIGR